MAKLSTLRTRIILNDYVQRIKVATFTDTTRDSNGKKLSPSKRGYDRRWKRARDEFLTLHPLCQCNECRSGAKSLTIAEVVDHVIPHRGDMILFWDSLNWQALSKRCHDKKTWRETLGDGQQEREFQERRMPSDIQPSRIPCTIVCGPPNSGKHPYVTQHAGPNDIIIDLDSITIELSNLPVYEADNEWLPKALTERNRRLRTLATDTTHDKAWFIINAPDQRERALWARRLGATVTVLSVPLAECIRRINAEPYREGYTERMIEAATDWWQRNE